jgi:hypothetical protein
LVSTNNPVESLFSTPIPEEVWHYTTLAGFEGILTSGKLWATDVRFTNDKTEFIHARDVVDEYLNSVRTARGRFAFPDEELSKMLHKAFDEGALSPTENDVYVASFSAAEDLKAQWVEYADNCRGVSIAFDLRNIRPPKEAELAVTFAPCVYTRAEKTRLIEASLSHFTNLVVQIDSQSRDIGWMKEQLRTWTIIEGIYGLGHNRDAFEKKLQDELRDRLLVAWRRTLFDLLRVASHCKNGAFSAEIEWRLAMARPKNRPLTQPTLYRGTSANIPYLESDLFQSVPQLPITRIRTGPFCEHAEAVQKILRSNGYDVPVLPSNVPLRDTRSAF